MFGGEVGGGLGLAYSANMTQPSRYCITQTNSLRKQRVGSFMGLQRTAMTRTVASLPNILPVIQMMKEMNLSNHQDHVYTLVQFLISDEMFLKTRMIVGVNDTTRHNVD